MAASARLLTSVPAAQRERFTELAAARGVSVSHLLARLVDTALAESPAEKLQRLHFAARDERAPAEKYTVRLLGADAAHLEERAQARSLTASGYVAHVLRAHLRSNPPMPYLEFQELKRVVNELAGIRGTLSQLLAEPRDTAIEASLGQSVLKLLPALKQLREKIHDTLVANSKSWGSSDG
jgi:hypothetical protein